MCELQRGEAHYDDALAAAEEARKLDASWPKACYRMAAARLALKRCATRVLPPPPLHVALVPRSFARRARSYEDAALAAWEGVQMDNNNEELKAILQKAVALGREEHAQSKATTPPPPPATE